MDVFTNLEFDDSQRLRVRELLDGHEVFFGTRGLTGEAEQDRFLAAEVAFGSCHLFDRDRLARMKGTAILANVGRGSLVEEPALIDALTTGKLGGAVIDVTEAEPLPPTHEMWACPQTILTQHTAGGSIDEVDRKITFFHENFCRYAAGLPLKNVVDWERGY